MMLIFERLLRKLNRPHRLKSIFKKLFLKRKCCLPIVTQLCNVTSATIKSNFIGIKFDIVATLVFSYECRLLLVGDTVRRPPGSCELHPLELLDVTLEKGCAPIFVVESPDQICHSITAFQGIVELNMCPRSNKSAFFVGVRAGIS